MFFTKCIKIAHATYKMFNPATHVINPLTGRPISKDGALFKKLVNTKVINEAAENAARIEAVQKKPSKTKKSNAIVTKKSNAIVNARAAEKAAKAAKAAEAKAARIAEAKAAKAEEKAARDKLIAEFSAKQRAADLKNDMMRNMIWGRG
jgi:hypothetical protein